MSLKKAKLFLRGVVYAVGFVAITAALSYFFGCYIDFMMSILAKHFSTQVASGITTAIPFGTVAIIFGGWSSVEWGMQEEKIKNQVDTP